MIAAHLPALQVVTPMLAAPLCLVLHRPRLAWGIASATSVAVFAIAVTLLVQVLAGGEISYALGNWAAPWGIEYRIDPVNALVLVVVTAINLAATPLGLAAVRREIPEERLHLFYTGWLLCVAGMLGIVVTGDVFNVFVFLEISSLSSYLLVGLGRDPRCLSAAFRYLVAGTVGATFILIAIGLLYEMTGTLNMADLSERLPALADSRTLRVACAFLTIGIGIKMALFPLHFWLPDAYARAPSMVSVLLAGVSTKVSVYLLLRFFFTVIGPDISYGVMHLDVLLLPLALAAIFVASVNAIWQSDSKRLLAFSSVGQLGYITLGVSLATVTGISAALLHLFNHALIKGALFLALACVVYQTGSARIADMHGIAKRMPLTMAAFVAGGLSLIGVPATVGFISKWYLLAAAFEKGWWWLAALVLLGSLVAVIYIWKVVEAAYFKPLPPQHAGLREAPATLLVATWALVGANLYFGIHATLTVGVAGRAAALLLGVAP